MKDEGKFGSRNSEFRGGEGKELRMKDERKFGIYGGKAKKGEVRSLKSGRRDWGNEEFVIWYVCFAIKSVIS